MVLTLFWVKMDLLQRSITLAKGCDSLDQLSVVRLIARCDAYHLTLDAME